MNVPRPVTTSARNIIRNVVGSSPNPLTTREIFEAAMKRFPDEKFASLSASDAQAKQHVIPSLKFLKRRVMPDLVGRYELEKYRTKRTNTGAEISRYAAEGQNSWVWRLKPGEAAKNPVPQRPSDPEPPLPTKPAPLPTPKTHAQMYPQPEFIHLNPRRRRARPEKLARTQAWTAKLAHAEERGRQLAMKKPPTVTTQA